LIRKTPQLADLLRTILRNASSSDEAIEDNSDFEDESSAEENFEEGNEVVNLCRRALISMKKLPTLEELERPGGGGDGGGMEAAGPAGQRTSEEDVSLAKHGEQA